VPFTQAMTMTISLATAAQARLAFCGLNGALWQLKQKEELGSSTVNGKNLKVVCAEYNKHITIVIDAASVFSK
jgi:hypothetical protein